MQVCTAVFLHFVGLRQGGSDICPLNPQLLWIGNLDFWAWGFWASSKSIESLFEMGPESVREGQPKVRALCPFSPMPAMILRGPLQFFKRRS